MLHKAGRLNDSETCEDVVTWKLGAVNNYAFQYPRERAAALLHMSKGGDHIGQYTDTYSTTGVLTFTLAVVVLRCGRQGETSTFLSRGVVTSRRIIIIINSFIALGVNSFGT